MGLTGVGGVGGVASGDGVGEPGLTADGCEAAAGVVVAAAEGVGVEGAATAAAGAGAATTTAGAGDFVASSCIIGNKCNGLGISELEGVLLLFLVVREGAGFLSGDFGVFFLSGVALGLLLVSIIDSLLIPISSMLSRRSCR